jgi:pimeloyl-ACP methyl ester carboxylesterase
MRRADLAVVRAAYTALPSWPRVEPEDLRCSTLFIAGTENPWSMSSVDAYQARLAKCGIQVALLPGASHEAELAPDSEALVRIAAYLKR